MTTDEPKYTERTTVRQVTMTGRPAVSLWNLRDFVAATHGMPGTVQVRVKRRWGRIVALSCEVTRTEPVSGPVSPGVESQ